MKKLYGKLIEKKEKLFAGIMIAVCCCMAGAFGVAAVGERVPLNQIFTSWQFYNGTKAGGYSGIINWISPSIGSGSDSEIPTTKAVKDYADYVAVNASAVATFSADSVTGGTFSGDRLPAASTTKKGALPPLPAVPTGKVLLDSGSFEALDTSAYLASWVGSAFITQLGTVVDGTWAANPIGWNYINKTGSSLADLTTKSAADLTSGTLDGDRLPVLSTTKRAGVSAIPVGQSADSPKVYSDGDLWLQPALVMDDDAGGYGADADGSLTAFRFSQTAVADTVGVWHFERSLKESTGAGVYFDGAAVTYGQGKMGTYAAKGHALEHNTADTYHLYDFNGRTFRVSLWIKPVAADVATGQTRILVSKWTANPGGEYAWRLYLDDGRFYFDNYTGSEIVVYACSSAAAYLPVPDTWTHVAVYCKTPTGNIFFKVNDGAEYDSGVAMGAQKVNDSHAMLSVGNDDYETYTTFGGYYDELCIQRGGVSELANLYSTTIEIGNPYRAFKVLAGDKQPTKVGIDSPTFVVDTASGNVGIGTTTPDPYLHGVKGLAIYDTSYPCISLANSTRDWPIYMDGGDLIINEGNTTRTSSVERLRIESGGNVAINTKDSYGVGASMLTTKQSTATAYGSLWLESSSNDRCLAIGHTGTFASVSTNYGVNSGYSPLVLNKDGGNVGIGTDAPDYLLDIRSAAYPTFQIKDTTNGLRGYMQVHTATPALWLGTMTDHALKIATNDTPRITVLGDGNVGIGTTVPGVPLKVSKTGTQVDGNWYNLAHFSKADNTCGVSLGYDNTKAQSGIIAAYGGGDLDFWGFNGSGWGSRMTMTSAGRIYAPSIAGVNGGTQYEVLWDTTTGELLKNSPLPSSLRFKENIKPLSATDDPMSLLKVESKTFDYKAGVEVRGGRSDIGMIAEEVDAAGCKLLVEYEDDGRPRRLKYEKIVMYHQEIIRNQQKRIDALEARLDKLENASK